MQFSRTCGSQDRHLPPFQYQGRSFFPVSLKILCAPRSVQEGRQFRQPRCLFSLRGQVPAVPSCRSGGVSSGLGRVPSALVSPLSTIRCIHCSWPSSSWAWSCLFERRWVQTHNNNKMTVNIWSELRVDFCTVNSTFFISFLRKILKTAEVLNVHSF